MTNKTSINEIMEEFDKNCPGYVGLGLKNDAPVMVQRECAVKYLKQSLITIEEETGEQVIENATRILRDAFNLDKKL